jgi:hypothetical protein
VMQLNISILYDLVWLNVTLCLDNQDLARNTAIVIAEPNHYTLTFAVQLPLAILENTKSPYLYVVTVDDYFT